MYITPVKCKSLPIDLKNVIVIEYGDIFTEGEVNELIEVARKEKAFSVETDGDNPAEHFWIVYPNKPLQAIRLTETELIQDLQDASWND